MNTSRQFSEAQNHRFGFFFYLFLMVVIFIYALFLRLNNLGVRSLWVDEIGQILAARGGIMDAIRGAGSHFGAAPLDYVITNLVIRTMGETDAVLRLPAALFGTLTVVLLYTFSASIFRSRATGITSALLLAVAAAHIEFSQEVRWYSLSTMLAMLSANLLVLAIHKRHLLYWLLLAFSMFLCVTAALYNALIIASMFLALLLLWGGALLQQYFLKRKDRDDQEGDEITQNDQGVNTSASSADYLSWLIRFGLAALPAAIFVIYWYVSGSVRSEVNNAFKFTPVPFEVILTYPIFGWYRDLPPWPFPISFLGIHLYWYLAIVGVLAAIIRRKPLAIIPLLVVLITAKGILLIDQMFSYFWAYRQFIVLVPFYLAFVAYGLVSIIDLIRRPHWLRNLVWLSVLAGMVWLNQSEIRAYYNSSNGDWRTIGQILIQASGNPNAIIVYEGGMSQYMLYYQPLLKDRIYSVAEMNEILESEIRPNLRIWYSAPPDKVEFLKDAGWNSVSLGGGYIYMGQTEQSVLYLELTNMALPPQVFGAGFLRALRDINQEKALEVGRTVAAEVIEIHQLPLRPTERANVLSVVGRMYYDVGKIDNAISYLNAARRIDPTHRDTLENLGYVYKQIGNLPAAQEAFEASIYYHPRTYWAYALLIDIYVAQEEWTKVGDAHYNAYSYTNNEERKASHLGSAIKAYRQAGNEQKAQELLAIFVEKFPDVSPP